MILFNKPDKDKNNCKHYALKAGKYSRHLKTMLHSHDHFIFPTFEIPSNDVFPGLFNQP